MRVRQWPAKVTETTNRTLHPQLVARRNARERRRVRAVNTAFAKLRRVVPSEHAGGKRISKVKTLQKAIEYISNLLSLLQQPMCDHQLSWEYRTSIEDDLGLQHDYQRFPHVEY